MALVSFSPMFLPASRLFQEAVKQAQELFPALASYQPSQIEFHTGRNKVSDYPWTSWTKAARENLPEILLFVTSIVQ